MYNLQVPNLNRSISADPRNKTAYNRSMSADPRNGTNGLKTNIDLNDPAIQAKIGNRATKVVEKTIGMIKSEYYLVFNWINIVEVRSLRVKKKKYSKVFKSGGNILGQSASKR